MFKKKWFVPAAGAVLVLFTALMLILVYPHNKMPDDYTEAKDGVVYIQSVFSDAISSGSGFAIGENGKPVQYIVTNYHVVHNENTGEKAQSVTVCFSAAANRYMTAQVYRYSEAKDIAVLRLPEPTTEVKPLKLRKYSDNNISETFYALGYPARATVGTDFERYDKKDIVTTSGMISRQTMVEETDVYMLDLEITSGNSGGPLVNSKGEVVGINTFSITDENYDRTNYAVCIDEVTRLIDVDEVPFTLTSDVNAKAIIVIAAVVIVDVALAAMIVISLMGPGKKALYERPAKKPERHDTDSDIRRTVAADSISPTVAVSDSVSIISCISGQLKDKDFVLKDKLVFGRDPKRCKVVFPLDTEGVSGLHCQLVKENGKIKLTDLGSTYGTYVGNGLKIDKDTPVELKKGDTFSLGSDKNKFVVG